MQRRSFLKLLLPLGALLAGCRPSASVDCLSNSAPWLQSLKRFADPVLGKVAALSLPMNEQKLKSLGDVCHGDFVKHYRQQAATDFAAGKTVPLDGWILSETEAFTHRAVYLAGAPPAADSMP
jgi:hypothetical protein